MPVSYKRGPYKRRRKNSSVPRRRSYSRVARKPRRTSKGRKVSIRTSSKLGRTVLRKRRVSKRQRFVRRVNSVIAQNLAYNYDVKQNFSAILCAAGKQACVTHTGTYVTFMGGADVTTILTAAQLNVVGGQLAVSGRQQIWFANTTLERVYVTAYLCMPRMQMNSTSHPNFFRPELAFKYGFAEQQTDAGNVMYLNLGVTPYMNAAFCNHWWIMRKKSFRLQQAKTKLLTTKIRTTINWQTESSTEQGADLVIPRKTRIWMFVIHGPVGQAATDNGATNTGECSVNFISHETYKWVQNTLVGSNVQTLPQVTHATTLTGTPQTSYWPVRASQNDIAKHQ